MTTDQVLQGAAYLYSSGAGLLLASKTLESASFFTMRGAWLLVSVAAVAASAPQPLDADGDGWQDGRVLPRPGVYFGTRTHEAQPVLTGLAWHAATELADLRHACHHHHKLQGWGWTAHDGRLYGRQHIGDAAAGVNISVEFVQPDRGAPGASGSPPLPPRCQPWTAVIRGEPAKALPAGAAHPSVVSLFSYVALAGSGSLEAVQQAPPAASSGEADGSAPAGAKGPGLTVVTGTRTSAAGPADVNARFAMLVWAEGAGGRPAGYRTHVSRLTKLVEAGVSRRAKATEAAAVAAGGDDAAAAAIVERLLTEQSAAAVADTLSGAEFAGPRVASASLPPDDAWRVEELLTSSLTGSFRTALTAGMQARGRAERLAHEAAGGGPTPKQQRLEAIDPALAAVLAAPVVPILSGRVKKAGNATAGDAAAAAASSGNNNVLVLQHVLALPFTVEWTFLQEGCFAGDSASTAAPAAASVHPHGVADWAALAESLGVGAGSSADEAAVYRARYVRELCARMGLCDPAADAAAVAGAITAQAPRLAPHVYAAASAAVSNLIGSVTYFHGRQVVDPSPIGVETLGPGQHPAQLAAMTARRSSGKRGKKGAGDYGAPSESEPPHGLYTGVPSRSFFPRGFLWDEGFHQLIASQLQPSLSARVVGSWLDSQEPATGWIAREQILGSEARSRVPAEFRVQRRDIGNPPTLLLPALTLAVDGLCGRLPGGGGGGAVAAEASASVEVGADGTVGSSAAHGGDDGFSPDQRSRVAAFCARHTSADCVYACRPAGTTAAATSRTSGSDSDSDEDGGSFLSPHETLAFVQRAYVRLRRQYVWFLATQYGGDVDDDDLVAAAAAHGWAARHLAKVAAKAAPDATAASVDSAAASPATGALGALWRVAKAAMGVAPAPAAGATPSPPPPTAALAAVRAGAIDGPLPRLPPASFRWRGATAGHNFASGLDDYPRGAVPHASDENVDLLAWMAMAARILGDLAGLAPGAEGDAGAFAAHGAQYAAALDAYWHPGAPGTPNGTFCDFGVTAYTPAGAPGRPAKKDAVGTFEHGLVCHTGYVSVLPVLLRLLPHDDPRLGASIALMTDARHLASPHGLRSLSAGDPAYATGEDYWRSAVWINMNYLAATALRQHYGSDAAVAAGAPHAAAARAAGDALAATLVDTVSREYARSGFLWEHYSDKSGRGKGTHPFTGWTALVALLAAGRHPF